MAQSGAVPSFLPSTTGWHFGNDFTGPAVTVGVPGLGKIGLGNAAHGVCGAQHPGPVAHNINISHPVRGFMALRYARHDPPA